MPGTKGFGRGKGRRPDLPETEPPHCGGSGAGPVRTVDYGLVQEIALGAADPLPLATNPKLVEPLPAIVAL